MIAAGSRSPGWSDRASRRRVVAERGLAHAALPDDEQNAAAVGGEVVLDERDELGAPLEEGAVLGAFGCERWPGDERRRHLGMGRHLARQLVRFVADGAGDGWLCASRRPMLTLNVLPTSTHSRSGWTTRRSDP
jgi:hypothetical protein